MEYSERFKKLKKSENYFFKERKKHLQIVSDKEKVPINIHTKKKSKSTKKLLSINNDLPQFIPNCYFEPIYLNVNNYMKSNIPSCKSEKKTVHSRATSSNSINSNPSACSILPNLNRNKINEKIRSKSFICPIELADSYSNRSYCEPNEKRALIASGATKDINVTNNQSTQTECAFRHEDYTKNEVEYNKMLLKCKNFADFPNISNFRSEISIAHHKMPSASRIKLKTRKSKN